MYFKSPKGGDAMWYYKIPRGATGKRIAKRLIALKEFLASEDGVPNKSEDTLLLATWNIREFDSPAYGKRRREPIYYIAEIISHFDLVAVQEVREDLEALYEVMKILGGWWRYIATDVSEGRTGSGWPFFITHEKYGLEISLAKS